MRERVYDQEGQIVPARQVQGHVAHDVDKEQDGMASLPRRGGMMPVIVIVSRLWSSSSSSSIML